ncbi:BnaC09g29750D [Brassica napus]|uniref:BnaC09g29750D protein n=1 Tax=Brassica napus TaxID=3708 RepID=A0A078HFR9_BRANA|nr:BnaC09g29750D [Brassica napus]
MGGETNTVRETAEEEPLSPCSQLFNSPDFNCAIIVTMGCKVKGNPSAIIDGLKHTLVNHPRFSSIFVSLNTHVVYTHKVKVKQNYRRK